MEKKKVIVCPRCNALSKELAIVNGCVECPHCHLDGDIDYRYNGEDEVQFIDWNYHRERHTVEYVAGHYLAGIWDVDTYNAPCFIVRGTGLTADDALERAGCFSQRMLDEAEYEANKLADKLGWR